MNDIYNRKDDEFTVIGEVPESLKLNDPLYKEGFQAGAAIRDAEIQHLKMALADTEALELGTAEKCDQLRAQINVLREAATPFTSPDVVDETSGTIPLMDALEKALSSTPEQSLAEYRNKVIEDCAKQCEAPNEYGFHRTGYESAEAIRAMKEQP